MKSSLTIQLVIALFGMLVLEARSGAQEPKKYPLTVEVSGVKSTEGSIVVALFISPEGFPDEMSKAAYRVTFEAAQKTHTFTDLPEAHYVVVVFHDKNANGKLDKSPIGFPNEPVGLSNYKKIAPPRPDFEKAKVDITRTSSIVISLTDLGS